MKKRVRILLITVLVCVFAVSCGMLVEELVQYKAGDKTYEEAEKLVDLPDFSNLATEPAGSAEDGSSASVPYVDPYAEELRNMDFSALRAVNSEVLGWILIPNTVISYPLLQTDNDTYYLRHTWKKETSVVGSIFLECGNSGDFSDFNTVIYGHNMNNGSMFGSLKKYKSRSYWKAHPYVYITDRNGSRAYRIFAAYEVSTFGAAYQVGFSSDASRQKFLDSCAGQSVVATGVTPTVRDHILTLSTCTGSGHATRWVVQAVLRSTAAADSVQAGAQKGQSQPAEKQSGPDSPEPAFSTSSPAAASSGAAQSETSAGEGTEHEDQQEPVQSQDTTDTGTAEAQKP